MNRQADDEFVAACRLLLERIEKGKPILTAQDIHRDVPTIHNFAGRYKNSVEHLGFGMLEGKTEHGTFDFDGGGAMNRDGGISWTELNADDQVLRDLGYDIRKVKRALEELIEKGDAKMASDKTAAKAIEIVKIHGSVAEREPRFMIRFGGSDWGQLFFNMTGYVAEKGIPVPSSDGKGAVGLQIGERSLSAYKGEIARANREWAALGQKTASDDDNVAQALLEVAKALMGSERTAAVKDLKELKTILPELRKKQREYEELKRQQMWEANKMWGEMTKELEEGTDALQKAIKETLVKYFESAGYGVRRADHTGSLVEVFLGSKDGAERVQSKVSTQIALTFEGREKATYMIRNEDIDETIEASLSDTNTVSKLIAEVKKADKKGFWKKSQAGDDSWPTPEE